MDIIDPVGLCFCRDLGDYISRYSGYTRLRRLAHIAVKCPQFQSEAVRLLIAQLKQGVNTAMYMRLYEECPAAAAVEPMDTNWAGATDRAAATRLETLLQELNAAKSMISKEGIRKAHSNIGDFYYERGFLEEAMKAYSRCRDYCTMPWQLDEMFESTFCVSADLDQFRSISAPSHGKTAAQDPPNRPFGAERRLITAALLSLRQRDFAGAARYFLDLKKFGEAIFPTILSSTDIAVYGTILAVSSLSREELRSCASSGHNFKQFIEHVPQMEAFLSDFLECRYQAVMDMCAQLVEQFNCDIILSRHLEAILSLIMDRVFLQYVEPYEAIDITKMATALNKPVQVVVTRLAGLIANGKIQARLDSVSMTLRRVQRNNRDFAFKQILKLSDEYSVNSRRALLRMCMLQNGEIEEEQLMENELV